MQVPVYSTVGEKVDTIELRDDVFAIVPNEAVMHQALVRQLANARQGTRKTKTRREIRGGGKKPWRQKGTGRARQGSIRAPQWRGGGTVFGPKQQDFSQKMPRKMRRLALKSAISVKLAENQLLVVDTLAVSKPRAKEILAILDNLEVYGSALLVLGEHDTDVSLATNNIADVKALRSNYLNVRDLLGFEYVIMPLDAVEVVERILG